MKSALSLLAAISIFAAACNGQATMKCAMGWTHFDNSCWKLFESTNPDGTGKTFSWSDAALQCKIEDSKKGSEQSHLAKILSSTSNTQIESLPNLDPRYAIYWIGGFCATDRSWRWEVDGSKVTDYYNNFDDTVVVTDCTPGQCLAEKGSAYGNKWFAYNCTDSSFTSNAVCQQQLVTNAPTPAPAADITCPATWKSYNGKCWKLSRTGIINPEEALNWNQAYSACSFQASTLAKIDSISDNNNITQLDPDSGGWGRSWIGGYCLKNEWLWVKDQAPLNIGYMNFANPDDALGCEDDMCLVLEGEKYGSTWTPQRCNETLRDSICEFVPDPNAGPSGGNTSTKDLGFAVGFPVGLLIAGLAAGFLWQRREKPTDGLLTDDGVYGGIGEYQGGNAVEMQSSSNAAAQL